MNQAQNGKIKSYTPMDQSMMTLPHDCSISNTPMPIWAKYEKKNPGWLYMLENSGLVKIGKTTSPRRRFQGAKTWLPDARIVGLKPFWCIHEFERTLLCGIADCWHDGEWHRPHDDEWWQSLSEGFQLFSNHDRNSNTIDFGYWIGNSGMAELVMEQNRRRISLRKWQRQA